LGDGRRGRLISASDRRQAVELISEAVDSRAALCKACAELGISKRTYNRWRNNTNDYIDERTTCVHPEPANKLTQDERKMILKMMNSEEFSSKTPCEIVPILADRGIYLGSESTFYKVLDESEMLAHRGRAHKPQKRPISTHKATAPDEVWMWDITYLNGPIKGKYYYLYLFSDLFSRKIVGWEVWDSETAEHASELIKRIYRDEKIYVKTKPLVLHSDNGSPMKGATMLETLYSLGIIPSRSRPRVSNDNPYAESIFKTLKYVPDYQPEGFVTLTEARIWVKRFVDWYNNEHRHSGINYVTPSERHAGKDIEVIEKRKAVYEKARQEHPERWSGEIRSWDYSDTEWLNPRQKTEEIKETKIS
jgi:putative transposase